MATILSIEAPSETHACGLQALEPVDLDIEGLVDLPHGLPAEAPRRG